MEASEYPIRKYRDDLLKRTFAIGTAVSFRSWISQEDKSCPSVSSLLYVYNRELSLVSVRCRGETVVKSTSRAAISSSTHTAVGQRHPAVAYTRTFRTCPASGGRLAGRRAAASGRQIKARETAWYLQAMTGASTPVLRGLTRVESRKLSRNNRRGLFRMRIYCSRLTIKGNGSRPAFTSSGLARIWITRTRPKLYAA